MAVLFEGELFADYHQIYVADSKLDFVADYPTQWTDEILAQGVNPGPGVVIVCTARDMNTAFRVELHESEPAIDLDAADHAAECGIVTAGEIIVGGCTSHEGQDSPIAVPAGPLRALVVERLRNDQRGPVRRRRPLRGPPLARRERWRRGPQAVEMALTGRRDCVADAPRLPLNRPRRT
ncbi:hypothetical protein [Chenggangzhangella methanolivorans]|uniref:Uncharacterized protein n=1 Tax=Chenggangzhangella methanolivorans TaxID=1437009 RepID=A0A9E6R546_9HYPH|nr:hypothetical protein [Chenggangzhangella methanolivorans]QZN98372.1 hypothetical protein K6K41_14770 [Chenggangzhangella methanolivorans]